MNLLAKFPAKLRLDAKARVPIRAALSASIALVIAYKYPTQRWYWAVLVAVILVTGTFGEGTQKGLTRFAMTAAGCVVTGLLSHLFGGSLAARVGVMLGCIFLSVYFRGASYGWFTFFITVYVVFLFAVFGTPTAQVTVFRVYETFVGCGIALAASLIVPMPLARRQWEEEAAKFWRTCRDQTAQSFEALLGPVPTDVLGGPGGSPGGSGTPASDEGPGAVPRQLSVLATRHALSNFETFFSRRQQRHRYEVMVRIWRLAQAVLALDHVASAGVSAGAVVALQGELAAVRDTTLAHLDAARAAERIGWAGGGRGEDAAGAPAETGPRAFCEKLAAARERGLVTGEEFLVLEAVYQFSAEVVRLVSETELEVARVDNAAPSGRATPDEIGSKPGATPARHGKPASRDVELRTH